jgi:hypothetical protein
VIFVHSLVPVLDVDLDAIDRTPDVVVEVGVVGRFDNYYNDPYAVRKGSWVMV